MPVLTTRARDAACDAVVDLCEDGSGDANGDLVIRASNNAEISTHALSNPAFGNSTTGVATANEIFDDTNATGGEADNFILQDLSNAEIFEGTVGTSGAELNLTSTTISPGDTVSIQSLTVTMPAS